MNQLKKAGSGLSLSELEKRIEKNVASTWSDLKIIHDEEKYLETHKTWSEYLKDRWNLDRIRAHQFMVAAEVHEELLTIVNTVPRAIEIKKEGQLRELAKAPKEKREEVVAKAIEIAGDEPLTAKVIKQAVETSAEPPKGVPKKPSIEPKGDVESKAREKLTDCLSKVIFYFGNIGLPGQADKEVNILRKKAGI